MDGADPRKIVSWELNDRRRLEERVERLGTGRAYSQAPPTRTTHLYTNIEVMTAGEGEVHALCTFLIQTHLAGRISQRSGWNGFVLRRAGPAWQDRRQAHQPVRCRPAAGQQQLHPLTPTTE